MSEASDDFDVFLCHNDQDKSFVRKIALKLKEEGISPWLDEWNLLPGQSTTEYLEKNIKNIKSAAVFIGKYGIGHWQDLEINAFIYESLKRKCPIIPVFLSDCPQETEPPLFLIHYKWVDFRKDEPNPLQELLKGIEEGRKFPTTANPFKGVRTRTMPQFKERPIIVLAAHDEGSGAHVIMSHICRGILKVSKKLKRKAIIVYLHRTNFNTEWATKLWENTSDDMQWLKCDYLEEWPSEEDLKDKAGIWLKTRNMIKLDTTADGRLNPMETRESLLRASSNIANWCFQIDCIPKNRVVLTIEMGVPQLNNWAWSIDHKPPAITVGDQIWSCVLHKTLELSGEYDEKVTTAILSLCEFERHATEVWFFPIIAPREYADIYAMASIPNLILPGFFGPKQPEQDIENVLSQISKIWGDRISRSIKEKKKRLIVLGVGSSGIWKHINNKIAMDFIDKEKDVLIFSQKEKDLDEKLFKGPRNEPEKVKLWMVADGEIKEIPQLVSLLPYYALADFGVTRGGVISVEFVNACTPLLVVQEPNNWLSFKQQEALREAGLAYTCSLFDFKNKAFNLIQEYLGSEYQEQYYIIKERMSFMEFGIEDRWAEYILRQHTALLD